MMSKAYFKKIVAALKKNYPDEYEESLEFAQAPKPSTANKFAEEVIYVICSSGFKATIAKAIQTRCMAALKRGRSVKNVFGHPAKARAIDRVWKERDRYYEDFKKARDVDWFETLPFIGPITKYHIAKNCGFNVAKADVHLVRLAKNYHTTVDKLCTYLADQTGYRRAVIDSLLWEACRNKLLSPKTGKLT